MDDDFSRAFNYAYEFYMKRLGLIMVFSVPFILAFLIPVLVPAPTYTALGGVFIRTGSIPELSFLDIIVTAIAYAIAVFVIADTIVNINLIIRSKRTLTTIKQEVVTAMKTYAMRIFYIYTLLLILLFVIQLLTYDMPFRTYVYPFAALLVSVALFFVPPAVVIDHYDVPTAIRRSIEMAIKSPHLVLMWILLALLAISFVKFVLDLIIPSPYSGFLVLLINSLFILPFLTILQTQMYMEKYPLAR